MNDAPTIAEAPPLDGKAIAELAEQLNQLLRLRTFPIGMKLFEDLDAMANVPGLRRPPTGQDVLHLPAGDAGADGRFHARHHHREHSVVLVVLQRDRPGCAGRDLHLGPQDGGRVVREPRGRRRAPGRHAARRRRDAITAWWSSPLRTARLDPPDICLFYGNPAQMILFINGLQWRSYSVTISRITGESACADSWGHALKTREVSLSIPCYAERRYGGVADDEMLMACPPADLQRAVTGLQGLSKAGLRYPIMPFGPQAEPAEGMAKSYAGKS